MKGGPYDRYVLLAHVDEPILTQERLETALGGRTLRTRLIDELYVLMSYQPTNQCCPLLRFSTTKT